MSKQGIGCLSDAHDYFNMCYVAGLLPKNFDLSKPQDKSVSTYVLYTEFKLHIYMYDDLLFHFAV